MVVNSCSKAYLVNLVAIQDTPAREVARSHSSCILSFDLKGQDQNKRFCVTEIVLPFGFADVIRELKRETFSGRRQIQPDVTSWFVQYCACSCSPHCRRAPVGDVKLVCLALWREREYLTFISIRFVAVSNQNFSDYRS